MFWLLLKRTKKSARNQQKRICFTKEQCRWCFVQTFEHFNFPFSGQQQLKVKVSPLNLTKRSNVWYSRLRSGLTVYRDVQCQQPSPYRISNDNTVSIPYMVRYLLTGLNYVECSGETQAHGSGRIYIWIKIRSDTLPVYTEIHRASLLHRHFRPPRKAYYSFEFSVPRTESLPGN